MGLPPLAEGEYRHGIDIHVSLFKVVHPTTTNVLIQDSFADCLTPPSDLQHKDGVSFQLKCQHGGAIQSISLNCCLRTKPDRDLFFHSVPLATNIEQGIKCSSGIIV